MRDIRFPSFTLYVSRFPVFEVHFMTNRLGENSFKMVSENPGEFLDTQADIIFTFL